MSFHSCIFLEVPVACISPNAFYMGILALCFSLIWLFNISYSTVPKLWDHLPRFCLSWTPVLICTFNSAKLRLTALKTSVFGLLKPWWKAGHGWVWIGYCWLCFKVCWVTIGELSSLGVIKFTRKYLKELCIGGFIAQKVNKNHSYSTYCTGWLTKNCNVKKKFQYA